MLIGGGIIRKGTMAVFERWDIRNIRDIRELKEHIGHSWDDTCCNKDKLKELLVLLIPTPCYCPN